MPDTKIPRATPVADTPNLAEGNGSLSREQLIELLNEDLAREYLATALGEEVPDVTAPRPRG